MTNHTPTAVSGASAAAPQGGGVFGEGVVSFLLGLEMGTGVFAIRGTRVAVASTAEAATVLSAGGIVRVTGSGVGV